MSQTTSAVRAAATGAWITALFLAGGTALGLGLSIAVNDVSMHVPQGIKAVISGVILLVTLTGAGAAWARQFARRAGVPNLQRAGRAGAVGFASATFVTAIALVLLEGIAERAGARVPIHVAFTLLFVPAVFVVTAVTAFAVNTTLPDSPPALGLAARTGVAAAGAFLLVDVLMDLAGWRVGAPGAAERATMLTVTMAGNVAAALAGGAVLGFTLFPRRLG